MEEKTLQRLYQQAQAHADSLKRELEKLQSSEGPWIPVWRAILQEIATKSGGTGETTIAEERQVLRKHLSDPRVGMKLFRERYLQRTTPPGPVKLSDPVIITGKGWTLIGGKK